jgi:hypothetical protein
MITDVSPESRSDSDDHPGFYLTLMPPGSDIRFDRLPRFSSLSLLELGLISPILAGIKKRTEEKQSLKALHLAHILSPTEMPPLFPACCPRTSAPAI